VPVAYEEARGGDYGSGIAYVGRLERDQTYSVWSYAAQPTPARLARSRPVYPDAILVDSPFLGVGNFYTAPPFGSAEREPVLREMFDQDEEQAQYEPLYRQARQVVGRPRNPYAAAVALEAWLRSSGEFSYDESPPVREGSPPLVSFVTATRRGYCQHFAGAMALMLRYLGIPARVAVGFTSGAFEDGARPSAITTRTPGSRSGSQVTVGSRSIRPWPGRSRRCTRLRPTLRRRWPRFDAAS
jgi:transglutaminase-like putative cysteine protease